MTTSTSERPTPQVGDVCASRDEMRALPLGSTITSIRSGTVMTRTSDGYLITKKGTNAPTRVREGDPRLIHGLNPGLWRVTTVEAPTEAVAAGPVDYNEETPCLIETLMQFKMRWRSMISAQASYSGVEDRTMDAAFIRLRVPPMDVLALSPGMPINLYDQRLMRRLPAYSVVAVGDPRDRATFGMWGVPSPNSTIDYLTRLAGAVGANRERCGWVESIPGVPRAPWVDEVGGLTSGAEIAAFKDSAWGVGWEVKEERDWCAEYEAAMRRSGVYADPNRVPQMITAEQVKALPVGAIVKYEGRFGQMRFYRRDDASTNPAGTVGIAGNVDGHWALMTELLWDAQHEAARLAIPVTGAEDLDMMPLGSVMRTSPTARRRWTKTIFGTGQHKYWTDGEAHYNSTDFDFDDGAGYVITEIGAGQ